LKALAMHPMPVFPQDVFIIGKALVHHGHLFALGELGPLVRIEIAEAKVPHKASFGDLTASTL
jgi:hypothetical protein